MKILLCISTLKSGGAEKNISILANFLIRHNYEVTILTFDRKNSRPFFFLDKKVNIINLDLLRNSKGIFSSIKNFIFRINTIRKLLIKGKFDYFISYINTMNITMLISAMFLNIKKIISDRNNPYYSRNSIIIKIFKILFYPYADKLIIQTKEAKSFYWFLKKEKISIINNFFNSNLEAKKNYIPKKKLKIIVVSKIEKQKGIELLVNSLSEIFKIYNFQCDIYGTGSQLPKIKRIIKKNKMTKIIFLKKTQDLAKIYKNYDIYVLSSYYEGYPNSLVEAMICGIPVISSSCNYGPYEIISDNINGLLFKVGSKSDLINKIQIFITDYNFATKLGKRAKKDYIPDQINNKNFQKWLNILRKK